MRRSFTPGLGKLGREKSVSERHVTGFVCGFVVESILNCQTHPSQFYIDYFLINLYPILGKVRGIMTTKCPNANQILESWAEEEWEEYTKGGCYD
ncbi:hypothetical protein ES703_90039 [subsurface metagenome]